MHGSITMDNCLGVMMCLCLGFLWFHSVFVSSNWRGNKTFCHLNTPDLVHQFINKPFIRVTVCVRACVCVDYVLNTLWGIYNIQGKTHKKNFTKSLQNFLLFTKICGPLPRGPCNQVRPGADTIVQLIIFSVP